MTNKYSYLDLVNQVDVLPYPRDAAEYENVQKTTYQLLSHDGRQEIGRIIPSVYDTLLQHYKQYLHKYLNFDQASGFVQLKPGLDTFEKRNHALDQIAEYLKSTIKTNSNASGNTTGKTNGGNLGAYLTKGWRNEKFVCYYPARTPYFLVERSLAPALGIAMYGVHINGYIPPQLSQDGQLKLWIAKRSLTKPTFPGKLDNTIAGGIAYPYSIYDTVVKESKEEAGLDKSYVDKNVRSVGVITYLFSPEKPNQSFEYDVSHDEEHFIQPECEFIYDLQFGEINDDGKVVGPQINNDEVFGFTLMTVNETIAALQKGDFKPNCAVVIIDFLIRHGIITPSNEPDFIEINQRIHRVLQYPTM